MKKILVLLVAGQIYLLNAMENKLVEFNQEAALKFVEKALRLESEDEIKVFHGIELTDKEELEENFKRNERLGAFARHSQIYNLGGTIFDSHDKLKLAIKTYTADYIAFDEFTREQIKAIEVSIERCLLKDSTIIYK